MADGGFRVKAAGLVVAAIELGLAVGPTFAQTANSRIDEALQNIAALVRTGRVGYATFWDGNKYIQCRRMPERTLRCEAAGTSMQPSLRSVLTGERRAPLLTPRRGAPPPLR